MAVFAYRAMDTESADTNGVIVADTPFQARQQLRSRGLTVRRIQQQSRDSSRSYTTGWLLRRQSYRVEGFVSELATLLSVGMPLLDTLDTLANQYRRERHGGRFAGVVLTLRDRVAAGASLAEAMGGVPELFDALTINMTSVGESAGNLESSLERVAGFKQRSSQLRGKLATALIYPVIVLLTGIGVSLFLMTYVVPQLLTALIEAGKPLPTATRLVKGGSDLLIGYGWVIALFVLVLSVAVGWAVRTQQGRRVYDSLLLRLPGAGSVMIKQSVSRIALVLSALLGSGITFLKAIQITRNTVANTAVADALYRCEEAVLAGRDIGPALEESGMFPAVVIQVFTVGQQSGQLEPMLDRLAEEYDRQVATSSQRLAAILEPVMILALAMIIGLIAFATVLPILEAGNVMQ